MNFLNFFLKKKISPILKILKKIKKEGGDSFLVGGSVRDLFLNEKKKVGKKEAQNFDIDIEVHGILIDQLEKILKSFGPCSLVGKQFGVLKLHKMDVDFSVPRKDSSGRKPEVKIDEKMGIKKALFRRDITINAMAINLNQILDNFKQILEKSKKSSLKKVFEITDPYSGLKDLKEKKINPVSEKKFLEDPLRFYRVMQIISRFEFSASEKMNKLAKKINLKNNIAKERITKEFEKMLLKSKKPSLGLSWIEKIGRIKELFASLFEKDLKDFKKNLKNLDDFAKFLEQENKKKDLNLLLSSLFLTSEKAKIKSFFKDLSFSKTTLKSVIKNSSLSQNLNKNFSDFELKKIALKASPETNLENLLTFVFIQKKISKTNFLELLEKIKKLKILKAPIKALVSGDDLLKFEKPGPKLGQLIKKAYLTQIKENLKRKSSIFKKLNLKT